METKKEKHPLCTFDEAGEILRVSPKSIRNDMSGEGRYNLRKVKVGGKSFLVRAEVEKCLENAIAAAK